MIWDICDFMLRRESRVTPRYLTDGFVIMIWLLILGGEWIEEFVYLREKRIFSDLLGFTERYHLVK